MDKASDWLLMFLAITIVVFSLIVPRTEHTLFGEPQETVYGGSIWAQNDESQEDAQASYTTEGGYTASINRAAQVSIGLGNASYTFQPNQEYITIENYGETPVDITGWRLENGKATRAVPGGNSYVYYASDTGIIPQGTKALSPSGFHRLENIVLKPGEQAVVITGAPPRLKPSIISFKENACTGYLDEEYDFPSGHSMSCILPQDEPGVRGLDNDCQDYIDTMQSCHTPKFDGLDENGDRCTNCVDGTDGLARACVSFIKSNYSYAGCLANHRYDPEFEGQIWRVYLYRPFEMWVENRETISLYDRSGRLVAQESY